MPPKNLPELITLKRLIDEGGAHLQVSSPCSVAMDGREFPVYTVAMGNPDPHVPALGFFGGIHGLERIGTQIVLAFLESLLARLRWDHTLHQQLASLRLVFMPLVNPGGMWQATRCNPHGVDLMRNAPVNAIDSVPFLLGGQRYSRHLPWYRGADGAPMEAESRAVCDFVSRELLPRQFSLALDCHSGFGLRDRLWFPHACTPRPIEHLGEMLALAELMDTSLLHHRYLVEPQSRTYLAHGDLWDHLYRRAVRRDAGVLLPLTLEMGSWVWVRKNPRQLFSRHGLFNPLIEHRQQRVLRRHLGLLDFLLRAAAGHARWRPGPAQRAAWQARGLARWFAGPP